MRHNKSASSSRPGPDRLGSAANCLIGAGANILGNIEVGHCARVAAGSVVLKAVPPRTTVAGVPARIVGEAPCNEPSRAMDQMLHEHDVQI